MTPEEAAGRWGVQVIDVKRHGSGHIHDTWRLTGDDSGANRAYILQRLNQIVFPNWQRLVENGCTAGIHVDAQAPGFAPVPLALPDGGRVLVDQDRQVWRLYPWIEHHATFDRISSPDLARECGRAFGLFQLLTQNIPAIGAPAIPGFLDLPTRLRDLQTAIAESQNDRLTEVRWQLEFVDRWRDEIVARQLGESGLVHADCKVNNLLFDAQDKAVAVVDLDTVMEAPLALDFGDLARSATALMPEDEPDAAKVAFDEQWFEELACGFAAGRQRSDLRGETMVDATIYMSFMLGTRFLADYLRGDVYFRLRHPLQNRDRTVAQFGLASAFMSAREPLARRVDNALAS